MATDFYIRAIKLAKYEDLRPAAYGVLVKKKKGFGDQKWIHKMFQIVKYEAF